MAAEFPFRTLRDFLAFLDTKPGQIVHLKEEVDLWQEVSAIARKVAGMGGPTVVYENIKGYPGWRVVTDALTTKQRQAWLLGLDSLKGFNQRYFELSKRLVKPVQVSTGPCKEVKLLGKDVDLVRIPIPHHTHLDAPPYFASGPVIVKDPETGWQNMGITRHQVIEPTMTNNKIESFQQQNLIYEKYARMGKPCPGAIVVGGDELFNLCAMIPAPWGVPEWDYWGAFTGEPFQVVKAETSDLLVPANAEIVVEGEFHPTERVLEGPHSEMPGFLTALRYALRFDVKAITMQANPVYRYYTSGRSPTEVHNMAGLLAHAELYTQLKTLIPEVSDVGSAGAITVVSVDRRVSQIRHGFANRVGMAVKAVQAGRFIKNVAVIEDHLDAQDVNDVLWAFGAYFQAARDITVIKELPGGVVDPSEPWLAGMLGFKGDAHTSFVIFDLTQPRPPYDEPYKRGIAQPHESARKMVEQKWARYGLPGA